MLHSLHWFLKLLTSKHVGFNDLKSFLSITFSVQYFNKKTPNDTPISYFLPGSIQGNINTFDGN